MRLPWKNAKPVQLDFLSAEAEDPAFVEREASTPIAQANSASGRPLMVPTASVYEDTNNPRTEFPQAELDDMADSIRQHGILAALVVHPADADGRYRIHFGAKRLRAALRTGQQEVPVVIRDTPADPFAQVAENQKRHGLSPLDMARFIRARVDEGESNSAIARRIGMNLSTLAHYLELLDLPPELDDVLKAGRCTSPRTLHELCKLKEDKPEQVQALLASGAEITRTAVAALREARVAEVPAGAAPCKSDKLIMQANAACDRLEKALNRIKPSSRSQVALPELVKLRIRVETISKGWLQGSDGQTPPSSNF